jgi:hypothetical protein
LGFSNWPVIYNTHSSFLTSSSPRHQQCNKNHAQLFKKQGLKNCACPFISIPMSQLWVAGIGGLILDINVCSFLSDAKPPGALLMGFFSLSKEAGARYCGIDPYNHDGVVGCRRPRG